ncbi:MAG: 6-hydroxymethylpterin diphosphokinase MptE-like protein [Halobacteria archaeon]|nr:6-hydroxymethylpterin diphosphokinase MptE-like protein [Halobacteria archaeon]
MRYGDWKPLYDAVADDLGISRDEDVRAAERLDEVLSRSSRNRVDDRRHRGDFADETAVVVGNAPCLDAELRDEDTAPEPGELVIVADAAVERLVDHGYVPDFVSTDLDGCPEETADLSHDEATVFVHAHGDNIDLMENRLPEFDLSNVVGTTQVDPSRFDSLHNFGGFTDGDRAAYIADELGARRIRLIGFDFDDPDVDDEKRVKLRWARRLLRILTEERERDGGSVLRGPM